MIEKIKLIGFRLLVVLTLFVLCVNIGYAEEEEEDVGPYFYDLDKDLQDIADHLAETAGQTNIEFAEMGVPYINAFAMHPNRIAITTGYIKYSMKYTGDYRFTIGTLSHEIGHLVLGHVGGHGKLNYTEDGVANRNQERAADYFGIELMWKAGYDCAYDAQDWSVQISRNPERAQVQGNTHPAMQERLDSSRKLCESLKAGNGVPTDMYFE